MSKPIKAGELEGNEFRKLTIEYRTLESTANVLQSRLELLTAALTETVRASLTLQGVKNAQEEEETLIPIGSGSFIKSKLASIDKTLVGVGANICIEKGIDEAIHDFKGRQSDLERTVSSLQQQLEQVVTELEGRRKAISSIVQQSGKSVQQS